MLGPCLRGLAGTNQILLAALSFLRQALYGGLMSFKSCVREMSETMLVFAQVFTGQG